jgi:hypothetical protein
MSEKAIVTVRPPASRLALLVGKMVLGTAAILSAQILIRGGNQHSPRSLWMGIAAYVVVVSVTFGVLRGLFSVRVSPVGVRRVMGRSRWVEWSNIRTLDAHTHSLLGNAYAVRSATSPTLVLLAAVAHDRVFLDAVERWAPPGNPLRRLVERQET